MLWGPLREAAGQYGHRLGRAAAAARSKVALDTLLYRKDDNLIVSTPFLTTGVETLGGRWAGEVFVQLKAFSAILNEYAMQWKCVSGNADHSLERSKICTVPVHSRAGGEDGGFHDMFHERLIRIGRQTMFENWQEELRRLAELQKVEVPIEEDSEGYADKECPAESCLFQFKIHVDDWKKIASVAEVFCPSCRHSAPPQSWYTAEQVHAISQYGLGTIVNRLNNAMRADAEASKRRQKPGAFLSITLDVKGGQDAVLVPIAAAEPMRLRTICPDCKCRYSYIGAAYFCPSCGKNSARDTFLQTVATIRIATSIGETLRSALSPDEAEVMTRSLLEKAMQDAVTSFQRLAEQLYEGRTGKPGRRNVFQNLDAGSDLWEAELGASYEQLLDATKMKTLRMYYQQRHLLAHQQGIVDSDYVSRSGDTRYTVGQRLVIRQSAVLEFSDLIERLGVALLDRCAS